MVYFIGGMLGVLGGILYSTSYNAVSLAMGFRGTIIAFTAAVIGGIGSLSGALVGGCSLASVKISLAFMSLPPTGIPLPFYC